MNELSFDKPDSQSNVATTVKGYRSTFKFGTLLSCCPVCGSREIAAFTVAQDFHYGIDGDFSEDRCAVCTLVFMNPMPSTRDLASLYPSDYYSYQAPSLPSGFKYRLRCLLGLERNTGLPFFARPGVFLDVGCGAGHYLLRMKARGWTVFGSELNEGAAAVGRRSGLDIRGGELMDAKFETEMFDFVRLNHSFEHMFNPWDVLGEIRRILKPEGRLFIGVPNITGFWPRFFGKYWWNFGAPVHTFNYTPNSLALLLEKSGFDVMKIRYYSDYSGLLGSLQIFFNRNRKPRSSDGPIVRSWALRPFGQLASRVLDMVGQGDCIEVIAVKQLSK